MKNFILVLSMFSSSVFASEIKVFEINQENLLPIVVSKSFAINSELERAWIEIKTMRGYGENEDIEINRIKINNLTFNSSTNTVMLQSEGKNINCANFVQKGKTIFKQIIIENTDNCRFEERIETNLIDNGFEQIKSKTLSIYLVY